MNHWSNSEQKKKRTFSHPIFFTNPENKTEIARSILKDAFNTQQHKIILSHLELNYFPLLLQHLNIENLQINLSYNNITIIPCFLYSMTNITKLDLKFNNLSVISQRIYRLRNLISLEIRSNKLKYLPGELLKMPKITFFNFIGNCWLNENEIENLNKSSKNVGSPSLKTIAMKRIYKIDDDISCEREFCSVCLEVSDTKKFYKYCEFWGYKLPFMFQVCSIGCLEECKSTF
ncbi:hypothetical protein EDEG_03022 [Edhazardia aedis USNM 41457]|uniref:Uncharacterized protein n=1 Tax=Edhazardia aedis (strain USNM 41457) TaxID=1003232 RepID=J9DMK4_EDHAE|nr:hypothetical protein EDEG_03022 [Edhazardia aedis USNM 41457]|eukprot:EJW02567.1 hypothetical protein EDEG_03022 [Edhazardia aedis USNM 41457]